MGVFGLATWVDWVKWSITSCHQELPTLPPAEAIDLIHQAASHTPASIPLLVKGLCDPRPEVAKAAQQELQRLQHQWENLGWHQVSESLLLLAESLADQREYFPIHSRQTVRQLAEWLLAWRPPEWSAKRLQMISACEKVLAYLEQRGGGAEGAPQTPSGHSWRQPSAPKNLRPDTYPIWREVLNPMEGFQWAGGGLPIEGGGTEDISFLSRQVSGPQAQGSFQPKPSILSSQPLALLKIREPIEADVFPPFGAVGIASEGGLSEAASRAWLNQPVRLGELAAGEKHSSENPSEPLRHPPAPQAQVTALGEQANGLTHHRASEPKNPGGNRSENNQPDVWQGHGAEAEHVLRKKEVGELLEQLAAASGEEQKIVQAELTRRGFGQVSVRLAQQLLDPDPQRRLDLVRRLPSMSGVEAVAWLFWLSQDADPEVRAAAMALLATTKDPAILRELERRVGGRLEPPFRRQTEQLRSFGQPTPR
ncbi:MAG: HEAT repeat domain-containing protein [Thermoguttaceae bacterium]|nr:HEAT repeat domain-containing protein [Thermoguttaceae bacterium]